MKLTYSETELSNFAVTYMAQQGFIIKDTVPLSTINGVTTFVFTGDRLARCSSLGSLKDSQYVCACEWPLECFVQCGGSGIVIDPSGPSLEEALSDTDTALAVIAGKVPHKSTAFFEAFPRKPDTFIRGEGATIGEAEESCWVQYQKMLACGEHEFERRDRVDGYCFCKKCELSGMFMDPLFPCTGCGIDKYEQWSTDKAGKPYCEECFKKLDDNMLSPSSIYFRQMSERLRNNV